MNRWSASLIVVCASVAWCGAGEPRLQRDAYGAITRGDVHARCLALLFTGDLDGESTGPILDALRQRKISASFFLTGRFLRQEALKPLVRRMVAEGHFVGPHSDGHLLYCDWDQRDKSLLTQPEFVADFQRNVVQLRAFQACPPGRPIYFVPPFEWFNREQVAWCRELSKTAALGASTPIVLANFTPGTGSQRDYAPEGDPHFVTSQKIYDDILADERREPNGLNGFLLLLHLGSGRRDPFHPRLGALCDELTARGYRFVRLDALLSELGPDGDR